ncbi:hypothetical protein [Dapis sp. BLCC M172]|uniref:hypothetical protein n=1 Tax=Dapis sp. BLCC M172 TaxID=2975281 RepID=UPI003CEE50AA
MSVNFTTIFYGLSLTVNHPYFLLLQQGCWAITFFNQIDNYSYLFALMAMMFHGEVISNFRSMEF